MTTYGPDGFEDGDTAGWTLVNANGFTAKQETTYQGSWSAEYDAPGSYTNFVYRVDNIPSGAFIDMYGWIWQSGTSAMNHDLPGLKMTDGSLNGYMANPNINKQELQIRKGDGSGLAATSVSISNETYYRVNFTRDKATGDMTADLINQSGTTLGSLSVTDNTSTITRAGVFAFRGVPHFDEVYIDIQAESLINAQVATITFDGPNASISPGGASIGADTAIISGIAPNPAVTSGPVTIQGDVAVLQSVVENAGISAVATIPADTGQIALSGLDPTIDPGAVIIGADVGSITTAALNAGVSPGAVSILADVGAITLLGQDAAAISPGPSQISADQATLGITAQNASRVFDSTTLSGTVTLNGSGVEGAKIYCIDDTNGNIAEETTTDPNGDYRVRVSTGDVYHMVVQYDDGQGNQYNDESKPFIAT